MLGTINPEILFLQQEDQIKAGLLDMKMILKITEDTYKMLGQGQIQNPPKVHLGIPEGTEWESFFNTMPSYIGGDLNIAGIKWAAESKKNATTPGIPYGIDISILSDPVTVLPFCIQDGTIITAMRTSAVAGLQAKYCAPSDTDTATLIGAGVIGRTMIMAICEAIPTVKTIYLCDLDLEKAQQVAKESEGKYGVTIIPTSDSKAAAAKSQLIVGETTARTPFIDKSWVKPHSAIVCVSNEATTDVVKAADVNVVDYWKQIITFKNKAITQVFDAGEITKEEVLETSDLVLGKPCRTSDEQFIYACSLGLGALDITVAYALYQNAVKLCFTAVDKSGASDGGEIPGALEPNWRDGQMTELPPVETDLGGGPVTICCRYGSIRRSKENAFYYRANMASSGAEIRINGRAIQHGLYNEIWGKALHPSQNRFLAQIDILSDQAEALPDTKAAKNGLREDDEKVAALFSWIRANIPEPFKEEGREQMLVRLLAEKKSAEPGVLRVSTEKNLYQCLNLQIKSDLFVSSTEGVTLFEAKAGGSKAEDLYQLRMYHDGCVADDMEVREAVLIAQRHPDTVKALLTELNRQKDKKGRLYHFALTTWDEEGITLPPDAA